MIVVSAYLGSIADPELGATAILNASNPHVALGSGVSGAISDVCGPGFQAIVRKEWQDEFDEPLGAGDCLVTPAGDATAFHWVLHVPAVDYTKRDPETGGASGPSRVRKNMAAALYEISLLLPEVSPFVFGVPLLGAGHGGMGMTASVDAMMGALSTFGREHPDIHLSVRFAVLKQPMLIENAASKYGLPFL